MKSIGQSATRCPIYILCHFLYHNKKENCDCVNYRIALVHLIQMKQNINLIFDAAFHYAHAHSVWQPNLINTHEQN